MLTTFGQANLVAYSQNLVSVQNFDNLIVKLNTAGCAFDVTNGLGQASATSTWVLVANGGFTDQQCIATMQYPSPTTAGTEDLGVTMNVLNTQTGIENYYYIRQKNQVANITKVIAGTFTSLTSAAFTVAQGISFTITASIVGTTLTANFTAVSGPAPVNLSIADSSLTRGGSCGGFRSLSKAVWCSAIQANQLL